MKKLRLVFLAVFSQTLVFSFAQNVGLGITSPLSKLHIKGSSNISQLCIDANIVQGNTSPLIKFRSSLGKDLIWIHSDDSTNVFIGTNAGKENEIGTYPDGLLNTAIGSDALRSNISGSVNTALGGRSLYSNISGFGNVASGIDALYSNISGIFNAAYGVQALRSNINGSWNTAVGVGSLYHNVDGNHNSAFGVYSLYQNTNGVQNTANGYQALYLNAGGSYNTATGVNALYSNIGGSYNTAAGLNALQFNVSGVENTAIGAAALAHNIDGDYNCAFGVYSLYENTTGNNNTSIGREAGNAITTGSNNTAIGWTANVPNATGSNQLRLGGTNITYAGVQVSWTITSDRHWKSDIQDSNLGLDFISKLRPVSYYRTNDESKKREYGFIAQELEEALNASGAADNGIISKDDQGKYGVRYNDLMTPMVKAIQEQQAIIENQNAMIHDLMQRIEAFEKK